MQNSLITQIKDLEEKRQALIGEARDTAMQQANDAIATLKELGIHYQIVPKNSKRGRPPSVRQRQPRTPKHPSATTNNETPVRAVNSSND